MLELTVLSVLVLVCCVSAYTDEELAALPGHLKEFGFQEKRMNIEELDNFPFPKDFFKEYVHKSKPLLMKGAAKYSKAFAQWTDEYFLNLDEPADHKVLVESNKKERREDPVTQMSFKDFVRIYNTTDQYLVSEPPPMIKPDVVLPGPLQCEELTDDKLVDLVMWFSSGGTKSVVHTDSVDNLNCLFRGEKTLVMVDPSKYSEAIVIDRPNGAYSALDVDNVDFVKYPGLADVEYFHADMETGDCLYIPYLWIHQVRSYGSNIAVNIWWDHHKGLKADVDQCPDVFDPDFTIDKVTVSGFGSMELSEDALKDHLLTYTKRGALDFGGFMKTLINFEDHPDSGTGYQVPLRNVFRLLDIDGDELVTTEEINGLPEEGWMDVEDSMVEFDMMMSTLEESYSEMEGDDIETVEEYDPRDEL